MNDVTTQKPMWLRVTQLPPLRLAVFGVVMFYMLGYSNKFIGDTAGNPLLQIAVVIGWSALGFAVYIGFVRLTERRPVTELALPGMGRELGIGLLVGAGPFDPQSHDPTRHRRRQLEDPARGSVGFSSLSPTPAALQSVGLLGRSRRRPSGPALHPGCPKSPHPRRSWA